MRTLTSGLSVARYAGSVPWGAASPRLKAGGYGPCADKRRRRAVVEPRPRVRSTPTEGSSNPNRGVIQPQPRDRSTRPRGRSTPTEGSFNPTEGSFNPDRGVVQPQFGVVQPRPRGRSTPTGV